MRRARHRDGEYCGDNDSQLDRINVFYPEASVASTYHARCSSSPVLSTLCPRRHSAKSSDRETS